ncbi:hypothetical protein DPMN_050043 [Dreissena polymorpha]|uniref:Uncharacterized protein n=1 Tax=Dreissena polymorpha TaxID=45954 RepID=A0A9D4CGE7_DREPO|nr:hypothetical protein DPMN_050043 [Dreissena polymorpha]
MSVYITCEYKVDPSSIGNTLEPDLMWSQVRSPLNHNQLTRLSHEKLTERQCTWCYKNTESALQRDVSVCSNMYTRYPINKPPWER